MKLPHGVTWADLLMWSMMAGWSGVEFGPRTFRVRWPTGVVEDVQEVRLGAP